MGVARAVVFGGVSVLPAILVGVIFFLILGGANEDWASWMWVSSGDIQYVLFNVFFFFINQRHTHTHIHLLQRREMEQ